MYKKIVMHVQSCCFANFGYVNMIPNSVGAATRIIQDTASFHTQEWLLWREVCDGAKLRRADLESGAPQRHISFRYRNRA